MSEQKLELRFHHAIPGWCKIVGLKVREIPECEGGGYMLREDQARQLVAASEMYKALVMVAAWMSGEQLTGFGSRAQQRVRAAIAKAEVPGE